MSFQAYLDNIEMKTGKTPNDFIALAGEHGYGKETKSGEITAWLKKDFELGHGHAMALVHVIKNVSHINSKHVGSKGVHSDPSDTLRLDGDNKKTNAVDIYIEGYDAPTQKLLKQVRQAILDTAPDAEEMIGYGIPSYRLSGKYMLHFGAAKDHIGLYATPDGHAQFEKELAHYKRGKGSVQFPLDGPLPIDLISRIARYRADQLRK